MSNILVAATYSSEPSSGGILIGALLLVGLVAAYLGYNAFKLNGFRPREVSTQLTPDQLREIFTMKVASYGWSIVDEGNPMVAQSSLLAGIRQQIVLQILEVGTTTRARIAVARYSKKVLGGATKAYTLRWRMSSFLGEVQRLDAFASVQG